MNEIETGLIEDGTAIGNGLATAVARLSESDARSRVVILLTDGVNNSGEVSPQMATEIAKQYGIKVYTIGVGKEGMAKYPVQTPWGVQLQDVKVEIDEPLLKEIAQSTGGKYFRATDNTKLAEIYNEINQMETGRTTITNAVVYEELFMKYLILALAFLMLELFFNWFVIRRMP
jgi:Ca-activated chloride channel family protein